MTVFAADDVRRTGVLASVRRLRADGGFDAPVDMLVPTELVGAGARAGAGAGAGAGVGVGAGAGVAEFWAVPGLVDAHVHAAWHDFDAADRAARPAEQADRLTAEALRRMFSAGFTRGRDAGGLLPGQGEAIVPVAPAARTAAAQLSLEMIDRAAADAAGGLDAAVERVLAAGARWVKLVGTAGVAAPAGATLEPAFTAAEVGDAVRRADEVGAWVMMHAWGGDAIDFAIDRGVRSIEHGIYLTAGQAARAAEQGTFFVPTIRVYRLVLDMIDRGDLPAAFRPRVVDAVAAHPVAVRRARDAGVRIAVGTDSGTQQQHGSGWHELAALVDAGLTTGEALRAATANGGALLGDGPGKPPPDLVLLRRDPGSAAAFRDPELVAAVIYGATDLCTTPTERTPK